MSWKCKECGCSNYNVYNYCTNCGTKGNNTKKIKNYYPVIIVGLILFIIVVFGINDDLNNEYKESSSTTNKNDVQVISKSDYEFLTSAQDIFGNEYNKVYKLRGSSYEGSYITCGLNKKYNLLRFTIAPCMKDGAEYAELTVWGDNDELLYYNVIHYLDDPREIKLNVTDIQAVTIKIERSSGSVSRSCLPLLLVDFHFINTDEIIGYTDNCTQIPLYYIKTLKEEGDCSNIGVYSDLNKDIQYYVQTIRHLWDNTYLLYYIDSKYTVLNADVQFKNAGDALNVYFDNEEQPAKVIRNDNAYEYRHIKLDLTGHKYLKIEPVGNDRIIIKDAVLVPVDD